MDIAPFLHEIQQVNLRNNRKRYLRKLLSRSTINLHNLKKLVGRRPNSKLLKVARTKTQGKKLLYWIWLQFFQMNALERMCMEKWGGFLDLPVAPITKGERITIFSRSHARPTQAITLGSIMTHDFRVKLRLPEGVRQLTVFLEYEFTVATHLGLYINGAPIGALPLPRARSGVFPVVTRNNALEISLRSPCNQNEGAIGFIVIRCDWLE